MNMFETKELAIDMIFYELRQAEEKHPSWPDDPVHAVAVLMEEAGEAMKAANDMRWFDGSVEDLKKELAQSGAMAIRALVHLCAGTIKKD